LCELVGDALIAPSFPSEAELKDLLSVPASRCSALRSTLVTSASRAANPQAELPAAAAGGDSQAAAAPGPAIVPMPIIRLGSRHFGFEGCNSAVFFAPANRDSSSHILLLGDKLALRRLRVSTLVCGVARL
jgi:hypothetical protein